MATINEGKWIALRYRVWWRDGGKCRYCGTEVDDSYMNRDVAQYHCDHVLPLSQGGTYDIDNLVTSCKRCNLRKGARTPRQANMSFATRKTEYKPESLESYVWRVYGAKKHESRIYRDFRTSPPKYNNQFRLPELLIEKHKYDMSRPRISVCVSYEIPDEYADEHSRWRQANE